MQAKDVRKKAVRCSVCGPKGATTSGHARFVKSDPGAERKELRISEARDLLANVGLQDGDKVVMELCSDGSMKVC